MATVCESSFTSEVSRSLLICAICRSEFRKPKVLSCQHSFCAKCLEGCLKASAKKTNVLKCSQCREITVLPPEGVDGLRENYAVKGLLSMLRGLEKKAAGKEKVSASKTAEEKASRKAATAKKFRKDPVPAVKPKARKTVPKSERKKGTAISKKDTNANVSRSTKENTVIAKRGKPASREPSSSEDEESDEFSDDDDSESCSSGSDSESDDDSDSTGSDMDAPPTPKLKNYGEISVGMEVYVFNCRGKQFPGRVKLLETCKLAGQRRTYAGIELRRENVALVTKDLDRIDESYLACWFEEYERPCTVVRADDCVPASIVNQLLEEK